MRKIWRRFKKAFCCCCYDKNEIQYSYFERAMEPTDVFWEHLDVSDYRYVVKTIGSFFVSMLLIGVSFGIIYGLTVGNKHY